ncbi:MAG: hypothetical protein LBV12_06050 [Puniceicoccales bacterium]|nr:hypothetical protein [Puniceicoccales bacterium]
MTVFVPAFAKMIQGQKNIVIPKITEFVINIGLPMSEHPYIVLSGIVICGFCLGGIFEIMRTRQVPPAKISSIMQYSLLCSILVTGTTCIALLLVLISIIRKFESG